MGEDASLDDFLGSESSEQSGAAESTAAADEADPTESATDAGSETEAAAETESERAAETAPAKTTYAWSGAGAVCEDCGETVERRWRQDSGLVCIECKDWERA